jgi:hypothetical protein
MILAKSKEARYPKTGKPRLYYRCANSKWCDVIAGAHPDGTPLGVPGNSETRTARYALHHVFDQLWITKRWSRQEAYDILAILTKLDTEEAHIACFDKKQCEQVMEQLEEFLELNPYQENSSEVRTPSRYRFVNVERECTEHGIGIHQVYLEGREEFCRACLDTGRGPTWRKFLVFKQSSTG